MDSNKIYCPTCKQAIMAVDDQSQKEDWANEKLEKPLYFKTVGVVDVINGELYCALDRTKVDIDAWVKAQSQVMH